jgi:protein-arginine kinase activator protein McsA
MAYTYEELHKKTVHELREIAQGIEDERLHGVLTMHKEQLLPLLCKVLGIEAHVHHQAVGINKAQMKIQIRSLKKDRATALEQKDYAKLAEIRKQIHDLKGKLRRAIV